MYDKTSLPKSHEFWTLLGCDTIGNQIRSNQNIKGMSINGTEEKLLQYADDTNPIISDDNSLMNSLKDWRSTKRQHAQK